jgi:hypothetical protein
MPIFCDSVRTESLATLQRAGVVSVRVLESMDASARKRAEDMGISVDQAQFFAGHLRDGSEAVYMTARRRAGVVALEAAKRLVASRPLARVIDERYGRSTVQLAFAKWLVTPIEAVLVRVATARVLAAGEPLTVWLRRPEFDVQLIGDAFEGVDVRFYDVRRKDAAPAVKLLVSQFLRRAWAWFVPVRVPPDTGPSVLVVREDDLHMDRSHRGQPHWIEPEQPAPAFRTYIATRGGPAFWSADPAELARYGLASLGRGEVARARFRYRSDPVLRQLRRDALSCAFAAVRTNGHARAEFAQLAVLLWRAEEMGALVRYLGVRTYVFGEPYLIETDAMQLAAPELGVETIAYQYSNLAFMSPLMLSTADRMVLFSSIYRPLWESGGIRPRRCDVGGYVYDGVAERVRGRARAVRESLEAAGATFVLCYFDENVQNDRWGCVHPQDHLAELRALAQLVVDDPSVGLVIKSQFERNSPSRLHAGDSVIEAARATGRYVELCSGVHRNNVFPVEAALSANLCIGHLIGATASLEAGLAGVRSTLLDTTGLRAANAAVYERADLVYGSIESLLAAVAQLRAGHESARALGDWSPIAATFDPIHDGHASRRLRALVERSVETGARNPLVLHSEETT